MQITGTVVKEKGQTVFVRTSRPKSCEHCASASVCNKKEMKITAVNTVGAKVGDNVSVIIENDSSALSVLAYMFLIPIILLFLGYFLFTVNPWLILIPIILIIPYYIGLKVFNKKFKTKAYTEKIIVEPTDNKCSNYE